MRDAALHMHLGVANQIQSGNFIVSFFIAVIAGLISFFSPCVLPLIPGYLSYAAGMTDVRYRGRTVLGALLFISGFTLLFVMYGALFGSLGSTLASHQAIITRILGGITIILGALFIFNMKFYRSFKPEWKAKYGLASAPLLGFLFGFGWTPCIGPTLSAVESLALQSSSAVRGSVLSAAYCIGIGVPFVAVAIFFDKSKGLRRFISSKGNFLTIFGGAFLIIIGLLQVSGEWIHFINWLRDTFSGFSSPI